jgi:hypothetical protein
MAYLDRRVHKTVEDFLNYLSQTMPITSQSSLLLATDHTHRLTHLDSVCEGDLLVLLLTQNEKYTPNKPVTERPQNIKSEPMNIKSEQELNPRFKALTD